MWADSLHYTLSQEEPSLAPETLKSWEIEGYLGQDSKTSRRHNAPKSRETTESSARDWTLTLEETTPHLRQVDPEEFPQPGRHLDPHSDCPGTGHPAARKRDLPSLFSMMMFVYRPALFCGVVGPPPDLSKSSGLGPALWCGHQGFGSLTDTGKRSRIIFIDWHHKESVYSISGCREHIGGQRLC